MLFNYSNKLRLQEQVKRSLNLVEMVVGRRTDVHSRTQDTAPPSWIGKQAVLARPGCLGKSPQATQVQLVMKDTVRV